MKRRALSLFLCVCMAFTVLMPINIVNASEDDIASSGALKSAQGLSLNKTATPNGDGSYKVSLEAYTTGSVKTTESMVPTDIILVLDQSGSMGEMDYVKTTYTHYTGSKYNENNEMYPLRSNLFVLDDGNYYQVTVSKHSTTYTYSYTNAKNERVEKSSIGPNDAPPEWEFYSKAEQILSRSDALKDAAKEFINNVSANAVNDSVDHRIALVTFGTGATTKLGLTALYSSTDSTQVTNGKSALTSAINSLPVSPSGATEVDNGMAQAKSIFDADTLTGNRNRMVVVFTDGIPTSSNNFDTGVADRAIATSKALKDNGTKIFTIGIFGGANKNQLNGDKYDKIIETDKACDGSVGSAWGKETLGFIFYGDVSEVAVPAGNRFLNYLSSNFSDAQSIGLERDSGELWIVVTYKYEDFTITANYTRSSDAYYLTASNMEEINSAFEKITETTAIPTISLGSDTVINDIISDYFKLPEGATASDINLYTQTHNGDDTWEVRVTATGVTPTVTGKNVSVTGFDFDANCVTQTAKQDGTFGKKLIIEFNIVPDGVIFGGNGVPTNDANSGVYVNDSVIANFNVPSVSLPISYSFSTADQKIYASKEADLKALIVESTGYAPNGKNNAYVDIQYSIKQGATTIGTYNVAAGASAGVWDFGSNSATPKLLGTSSFTIECVVTPSVAGSTSASNQSKSATIYVFTPYVSTTDSMANYNDDVDLNSNVSSQWKCVEVTDGSVPLGSAPTLSYEFTNKDTNSVIANADTFNVVDESNIKITGVTAGSTDLFAATTFNPTTKDFKIGINKFDLVISKTVAGTAPIDQAFLVAVTDELGNVFNVTISPSDFGDSRTATKKIKGLYCNMDYSVLEDQNWSWRYTADKATQTVNEAQNGALNTVSIQNEKTNDKWLSGESVANTFFSGLFRELPMMFNNGMEG